MRKGAFVDEAFDGCGQEPGLEIWRIEVSTFDFIAYLGSGIHECYRRSKLRVRLYRGFFTEQFSRTRYLYFARIQKIVTLCEGMFSADI